MSSLLILKFDVMADEMEFIFEYILFTLILLFSFKSSLILTKLFLFLNLFMSIKFLDLKYSIKLLFFLMLFL